MTERWMGFLWGILCALSFVLFIYGIAIESPIAFILLIPGVGALTACKYFEENWNKCP